jgi:hypothetical protein
MRYNKNGRHRFAGRPISFAVGTSAAREAHAAELFYRIPP